MKTIKISLLFPPNKIKVPLVTTLIKNFELEVNILNADIRLDRMGKLTADLTGTEWNLESALKYIGYQGIEYKLFNKKIIWQEGSCVHCGACTGICPSNALTMDKDTWNLTFSQEKCLVCELCVKTCPLGVIKVTDTIDE